VALVCEPEPVVVADVNPVLELDAAELVEEVKSGQSLVLLQSHVQL
jgi:hypothetical protein